MSPDQLHPLDPRRWLVGDLPWWFLVEVLVRSILIYVVLHVILRIMGRRVASQLSVSELAIVVTLGAAVGMPMQTPDRGLLAAVVILLVALVFQRGMSWLAFKRQRVEEITQGTVLMIVEDGRILLDQLERIVLSRQRLCAVLRSKGIEHLGQVRRVYAESDGNFSIFEFSQPRPGLSILPGYDEKARRLQPTVSDLYACSSCGTTGRGNETPAHACGNCGEKQWTSAVTETQDEEPPKDDGSDTGPR